VFCTHVQEDFEDTKGVIKIHKSQMYRQHNDYKEKDKRTNNDVQNTTQKTKDTNHSKQSKSKKSKQHTKQFVLNKRLRKPTGQSRNDNPETLSMLSTQDTGRRQTKQRKKR
jgi:uncharacterized protein YabN with tetrapyrrole methylase and pyrophosphatase domain